METTRDFLSAKAEIERAFAPLAFCYRHDRSSVRLRVYVRETDRTQLLVAGIPIAQVSTRQNVAKLVSELRQELDGAIFLSRC